jgi:DNA-binding transcriptional LysR family regulator
MVDIKQLRYFVVLAETLHFGRAAARLNLSQPPLSRQIAALERDLGVPLLERHSRTASLTRAGQIFYADAKAIVAALDQACRNAALAHKGDVGELSIGFMMCAAYYVVPMLTRAYAKAFPEVDLTLREFIPSSLVDDLMLGKLDVGILFPPPPVAGLRTMTIYEEPLCIALSPGHRLIEATTIAAGDLKDEPFILAPRDVAPTLHDTIIGYCGSAAFTPRVRLEVQLQQTIINFVAEGLGVALVPDSMRKMQLPGTVFRPLADAPMIEQVIAWNEKTLNPTVGRLLEVAETLD